MYIIAGLGNPGNKYDCTRHNIGFETLDYISSAYQIPINRLGFKSLYGQGTIEGEKVILIKPQTFMNLSGQAIKAAKDFYKVENDHIIIIHDDVSLDLGKLRVRPKGSDGGHNGIKNIIYMLYSDEFPRIKIGVGKPPHPNMDLADFVLGRLTNDEIKVLSESVEKAKNAVSIIIDKGVPAAMNECNG